VEIIDGGMALYDFLPVMMNREKIIIVDALNADDIPGAIYRFPADYLKAECLNPLFRFSTIKEILHQVYFASGKTEVEIIGIVPEDTGSEKICISESLQKVVNRAAAETLKAAIGNLNLSADPLF
jgi:hydrogenase maturation protease